MAKKSQEQRTSSSRPAAIYGRNEQAIQREMADAADRLDEQRRRLKALMRRLEGRPSLEAANEAAEGLDFDLVGLHVASVVMGALEITAGDLSDNIADLRRSAKATPASLAAEVRKRKRDRARSEHEEARRRTEQDAEVRRRDQRVNGAFEALAGLLKVSREPELVAACKEAFEALAECAAPVKVA